MKPEVFEVLGMVTVFASMAVSSRAPLGVKVSVLASPLPFSAVNV